MAHLDLFLQRGPQNGDVEASLEELRRIVLTDGIPANTDGTPQTIFDWAPFPLSRHKWQRIANHAPNLHGDNAWRMVYARQA